jgi:hypothetical protein
MMRKPADSPRRDVPVNRDLTGKLPAVPPDSGIELAAKPPQLIDRRNLEIMERPAPRLPLFPVALRSPFFAAIDRAFGIRRDRLVAEAL